MLIWMQFDSNHKIAECEDARYKDKDILLNSIFESENWLSLSLAPPIWLRAPRYENVLCEY